MNTGTMNTIVSHGAPARLALYLRQMFPLQQMVPYAVSHFLAIWFTLQALEHFPVIRITSTAFKGIATVGLSLLLMRLYDELKDAHTDIALGRAGDPLYRDRVLVTGAVRLDDVRLLRWLVTAALIVVNVRPAVTWGHLAFWLLFGVMWLSSRWFFWPPMSRSLLLAFVTHNPISLVMGAYVVALFADRFGSPTDAGRVTLLLVGLWLPMAAWETSRKIRAPGDETSYQTYSRVLGWKAAALAPALFTVGSAIALLLVARAAGLGVALPSAIGAAAAVTAARCALFRIAPSRTHANLKPWTMLYATVANAGLVLAVLLHNRVTW